MNRTEVRPRESNRIDLARTGARPTNPSLHRSRDFTTTPKTQSPATCISRRTPSAN